MNMGKLNCVPANQSLAPDLTSNFETSQLNMGMSLQDNHSEIRTIQDGTNSMPPQPIEETLGESGVATNLLENSNQMQEVLKS